MKCHPFLGEGDPESLKNNLKHIIALEPVIAIPGHGPIGDLNSLYMMINYIETLTSLVKEEIKKGTDENKVMELPMPEKYSEYLISSFYKINLKFLYQKLFAQTTQEP